MFTFLRETPGAHTEIIFFGKINPTKPPCTTPFPARRLLRHARPAGMLPAGRERRRRRDARPALLLARDQRQVSQIGVKLAS